MLPRIPCPECSRSTAVTSRKDRPRLYRHDPPVRDPELRSCPGSLKVVDMTAGGALVLFDVEPEPEMPEPVRLF